MTDNVLNHALKYAQRGIRIIPIQPGTKQPGIKSWQTLATNNPDQIRQWYEGPYKNWGVGIATGRAGNRQIFVLDIDDRETHRGSDTLQDLEKEHGQLPDTVTVLTPSGGKHLYFTTPIPVRNDAGRRLGPGLDIRGDGGQVLAPPTTHPNGGTYQYEHGYSIDDIKPADAPDWLIKRLTTEPKIDKQRTTETDIFLTDPNSPSARYNANHNWHTILTQDGWTYVYQGKDGTEYWRRPGKTEGVSASLNHDGNDALIVFSSNAPVPEGGYSKFGYYAQRHHQGSWKQAAATYTQTNPPQPTTTPDELLQQLVNWQEFWNQDHTAEDWIAYPLIAKARQTALFAVAKVGKSYLTLATVAALATGRPILGRPPKEPTDVLYLDYEMTPGDLMERLESLGYNETDNLTHLHYALIPSLPPLNTYEGAAAVIKLVELTNAQVVIIDTTGRAVEGEENSADTYRDFARTTGLALKSKGIALLRTDHAGKDKGKTHGQRGSSAKNDDVDLVYRMDREGHEITLTRLFSRIAWAPHEVQLIEEQLEQDHKPIRLKESMESFTEAHYDLARQILLTFPEIKPGTHQKNSTKFRQALRAKGIKAQNERIGPALRAIHQNRLRDPLA